MSPNSLRVARTASAIFSTVSKTWSSPGSPLGLGSLEKEPRPFSTGHGPVAELDAVFLKHLAELPAFVVDLFEGQPQDLAPVLGRRLLAAAVVQAGRDHGTTADDDHRTGIAAEGGGVVGRGPPFLRPLRAERNARGQTLAAIGQLKKLLEQR